ncbi:MAG TPA: hypothetical protein VEF72_15965 [Mycobacterium sp.]|nr:hypothetical protein [Mycobacterium sp.]
MSRSEFCAARAVLAAAAGVSDPPQPHTLNHAHILAATTDI